MAKWLDASASLSRPGKGGLATPANFAPGGSGVPARGAVGGRERVAVAADLGQHDVGLVVERLQDGRDEARVQERDVGGRDVRRFGLVAHGVQAGGDALERAAALA